MMKTVIRLVIVSILLVMAAPAFSATVVQVYNCEQDDDTSDADVMAMVSEWLAAAKGMKGGAGLEVYVNFPIAAPMGESDLTLVLVAPSFAEWGMFTDAYEGSAAEKVDQKHNDDLDCPDSTLWESVQVE